ncbi:zinc finger protein dzip1 [Holotrichia oblita]|uniref:Zinc finger protein dzip1 n=1 Tax=Holotrichia oblita TaxID=644536 RepID=A0ACB9TD21_HOLOL|nr:zinc finger protein dzip1 [Holotrichia oblita]
MCTENHYWHHDYVRLAWDSGFTFNTHRAKLNYDWRNIGLLDVDRVVRDRDVATIEKHIGTILNYSLDEDQTKLLEPTFVKVFQLSQLSMQYLQFCKRYLDNTVVLLKKELSRYKEENSNLRDSIEDLKKEVTDLKKQVQELKQPVQQQLQHQQQIMPDNFLPATFKCNICCKMFVSEDFLLSHVKRRHEIDNNPFQTETDRLQLEIKELKERLNSTEKLIQSDSNTKILQQKIESIPNNDAVIENTHVDDLKDKFDHLKVYVEKELTVLRQEKHYQEKYEKWFEMVFQRFDSARSDLQDKQEVTNMMGDGDKLIRTDSSTQTVTERGVESETMTDELENVVSNEKILKPVISDVDVQKIQDDIRTNTENHLGQIQGALEQKLSGGFEQIQSQMDSFWKKISDMEIAKKQNSITSNHSNQKISTTIKGSQNKCVSSDNSEISSSEEKLPSVKSKPIPAPRITSVKKIVTVKQNQSKETKLQEIITQPARKTTIVKPRVQEQPQETSSEEESVSSDDTIEIVKPSVMVRNMKSDDVKVKETKSKSVPNYPKMYRRDLAESFSESESADDNDNVSDRPEIKPSTSTLGQRSLTSLKQSIKDDDVIKGLNREIQDMINSRLREIGISPNWKGIPDKSYQQAIKVVKHQSELSKKKYPNYGKIRKVLMRIVKERVNKGSKNVTADLDEKKSNQSKIIVLKQPVSKRRKKSKQSPGSSSIEETQPKPHPIRTIKNLPPHEKKTQQSVNLQNKPILVTATPVKKKVLFDLEEPSSTSKEINQQHKITSGTLQRQQIKEDDLKQVGIEKNVVLTSPTRVSSRLIQDDIRGSAEKTQRTLKINDGGSTSSLASFILEVPKGGNKKDDVMVKDDLSDWDVSDIMT